MVLVFLNVSFCFLVSPVPIFPSLLSFLSLCPASNSLAVYILSCVSLVFFPGFFFSPQSRIFFSISCLLLRFDLQFLLLDRPDPQQDARMASHILSFFKGANGSTLDGARAASMARGAPQRGRRGGRRQQQQQQQDFVSRKVLRAFIEKAKEIEPQLSE